MLKSQNPEKGSDDEKLNLRLEALRLAHHPGQKVEEVVGRATRYEHFLKTGADKPPNSDNPDPFE